LNHVLKKEGIWITTLKMGEEEAGGVRRRREDGVSPFRGDES
jgi:hypothetical protein